MKSKINDPTYDFVQGIYMLHVPDKSELSNPFSANKRQRSKRIVVKTEKGFPEDVNSWTSKTFVDYFADEFKKNFSGFYKVTYTSDNKIINTISDFMEDNNLQKNEWTKKFIDWCFVNKEVMIKKNGHFLLMNLPSFLNRYYQDVVVSDHKTPLINIKYIEEIDNFEITTRNPSEGVKKIFILNSEEESTTDFKNFCTKIFNNINNLYLENPNNLLIFELHTYYSENNNHSELLIFQIIGNTLYIVNYDPNGADDMMNNATFFLNLLGKELDNIIKEKLLNFEIEIIYKCDLFSIYKNYKINGLQTVSKLYNLEDIKTTEPGTCLLFSYFIFYCLNYIQYSSDIVYPCSEIIKKIEFYIYTTFFQQEYKAHYFSNILLNFAFYVVENSYKHFHKEITKNDSQYNLEKYFKLFINSDSGIYNSQEKDNEYKKYSGYPCYDNNECVSNNCIDNLCYANILEINPNDIRNVGNPCLYNIQCRSNNCINNICSGTEYLEKNFNPEYYDDNINYEEISDDNQLL